MTTTNKSLNQPAQGSLNWDVPLNENFGWIDNSLGATASVNITGVSTYTLTLNEYRCLAIIVTGAMSNNTTITIPSGIGGSWIVYNNTTDVVVGANHTVTFASGGGGTTVVTNRGLVTTVWSDGTNVRYADNTSSPAAPNRAIQYNDDGNFGGSSTFVYNSTNGRMGLGAATPAYTLDIRSPESANATLSLLSPSTVEQPLTYYRQTGGNTWYQGLTAGGPGATAGDYYLAYSGSSGGVAYRVGVDVTDVQYHRFYTNSTTALYISADQRLGVGGTTSPGAMIDVKTDAGATPMLRLWNTSTTNTTNRILFWGDSNSSFNQYAEIRSNIVSKGSNIGAPIQGSLAFYTTNANSNTSTFRAIIDENGNFGVGNATPAYRVSAVDTNPTRGIVAQISNNGTSSLTGSQLLFTQNTIGDLVVGQPAGSNSFSIWTGRNTGADGTRIATINATGLAVGPDLPAYAVDVYKATSVGINVESNAEPFVQISRHSSDTGAPTLYFEKSRGTKASPSTTVAGDAFGILQFSGYSGGSIPSAEIRGTQDTGTAANMPGKLSFFTKPNSSTGLTENMTIGSDGQLSFNSGFGSSGKAYGCRAWVNFNGTGTVAIRRAGNVTSITDLGVGLYQVNMTTAMPDTNYAPVVTSPFGTNGTQITYGCLANATFTTTSFQVAQQASAGGGGGSSDPVVMAVAVFR